MYDFYPIFVVVKYNAFFLNLVLVYLTVILRITLSFNRQNNNNSKMDLVCAKTVPRKTLNQSPRGTNSALRWSGVTATEMLTFRLISLKVSLLLSKILNFNDGINLQTQKY